MEARDNGACLEVEGVVSLNPQMVKTKRILLGIAIAISIIAMMVIRNAPSQQQKAFGYYLSGAALVTLLVAGILQAIEWTRKNVRIE